MKSFTWSFEFIVMSFSILQVHFKFNGPAFAQCCIDLMKILFTFLWKFSFMCENWDFWCSWKLIQIKLFLENDVLGVIYTSAVFVAICFCGIITWPNEIKCISMCKLFEVQLPTPHPICNIISALFQASVYQGFGNA